jgi:hypothetical protein
MESEIISSKIEPTLMQCVICKLYYSYILPSKNDKRICYVCREYGHKQQ